MEKSRILLVVTGGIAAFKSAALVSAMVKGPYEVRVIMTAAASQFVAPATFAALSGHPVVMDTFDPSYPLGPHIELTRWAELLVVAPATANWIAKAANGLGDDLSSLVYLAFFGPTLIAPAMNAEMWRHRSVQRNVAQLAKDGVAFVGPEPGWQACRTEGEGRMAELPQLLDAISLSITCS